MRAASFLPSVASAFHYSVTVSVVRDHVMGLTDILNCGNVQATGNPEAYRRMQENAHIQLPMID